MKNGLFMNIGKDMNFTQFRKVFLNMYTGIFGFWIFVGAIFLAIMILLFVFVYPLSNQYVRTYKNLEDLSTALEKYAVKKDIYNEKWIASRNLEAELYDKEVEKCKSFLKGQDNRLEAIFLIDDLQKGLIKVEDEALWKNEYSKRVSALLTKLEINNIPLSKGALPFADWGLDIPAWDIILPAQKKFWILEAIVNIAANNAGITKLEKVAFRESSYTYNPSLAQLYTAIPVTIQVELKADSIKCLLHEILKSDIPFVIEGITIMGTDKVFKPDQSTGNEDVLIKDTNTHLPNPIIDVTLDTYIIDYKA